MWERSRCICWYFECVMFGVYFFFVFYYLGKKLFVDVIFVVWPCDFLAFFVCSWCLLSVVYCYLWKLWTGLDGECMGWVGRYYTFLCCLVMMFGVVNDCLQPVNLDCFASFFCSLFGCGSFFYLFIVLYYWEVALLSAFIDDIVGVLGEKVAALLDLDDVVIIGCEKTAAVSWRNYWKISSVLCIFCGFGTCFSFKRFACVCWYVLHRHYLMNIGMIYDVIYWILL